MINTLYQHIRHNYPILHILLLATLLIGSVLSAGTIILANTEIIDLLGASTFKIKLNAIDKTIYWTYQEWKHNSKATPITPLISYGFLKGVNGNGSINIVSIKNNKYINDTIVLADTIITDNNLLNTIVNTHKHDDVQFDQYIVNKHHIYTVVWINNEPFNLRIIQAGAATPDTTPETNIVDQVFAEYYWKQAIN